MSTASQATDQTNVMDHSVAWDWEKKHVSQATIDGVDGQGPKDLISNDIVEAGTVLICAGPADLEAAFNNIDVTGTESKTSGSGKDAVTTGGNIRLVPIGLVESASISINKQLNRIYEIGSKQSYLIGGRVMGGMNMNRVFFDGPSLLKVLYRGEVLADSSSVTGKKVKFSTSKITEESVDHIGSGNLAMNLESKFFDRPFGLAFIFRDQEDQNVSEMYFEGCNVSTYGMGISARANVLNESISLQFTKVRPIVTDTAEDSTNNIREGLSDIPIVGTPTTGDTK